MKKMIADYMENGFLDNIIDMFMHDSSLYCYVADLIKDERLRVRIGATALIEELSVRDRKNAVSAAPGLLPLLVHPEPIVRGDAANLLGIIGDMSNLPFLEKAADDSDPNVRLLAREAISEMHARNPQTEP